MRTPFKQLVCVLAVSLIWMVPLPGESCGAPETGAGTPGSSVEAPNPVGLRRRERLRQAVELCDTKGGLPSRFRLRLEDVEGGGRVAFLPWARGKDQEKAPEPFFTVNMSATSDGDGVLLETDRLPQEISRTVTRALLAVLTATPTGGLGIGDAGEWGVEVRESDERVGYGVRVTRFPLTPGRHNLYILDRNFKLLRRIGGR